MMRVEFKYWVTLRQIECRHEKRRRRADTVAENSYGVLFLSQVSLKIFVYLNAHLNLATNHTYLRKCNPFKCPRNVSAEHFELFLCLTDL